MTLSGIDDPLDPDRLIDALDGIFPPQRDRRLALTLLSLLAGGAPVSLEQLADRSASSVDEVAQRLATWPNLDCDEAGRVVAFVGLSLTRTAHRFLLLGDRTLFTWCAWDALFLPELLGQTAQVQSTCAVSGRPISLIVTPRGVADVQPAGAMVSMVAPPGAGDVRATFCCNVGFLASDAAGEAWRATYPDGVLISIEQASELGRRTNARFFKHGCRKTGAST